MLRQLMVDVTALRQQVVTARLARMQHVNRELQQLRSAPVIAWRDGDPAQSDESFNRLKAEADALREENERLRNTAVAQPARDVTCHDDLIGTLRERIRQLEDVIAEPADSLWLLLTPDQAVITRMLLSRTMVKDDQFLIVLYGARPDADDPPDKKTIDTQICKIRKTLKPHGVQIETVWHVGYRMTPENKARLRALLSSMEKQG